MIKTKKIFLLALLFSIIYCLILTTIGINAFINVFEKSDKIYEGSIYRNLILRSLLTLSYMGCIVTYLIWLTQKNSSSFEKSVSFFSIFKLISPFIVLAYITYPFSTDIYSYLHSGLMGLARVNPYLVPAKDLVSIFSPFLAWGQTSTYGAISQVLFMLSASTAFLSPLIAVYILKIFCLTAHIVNGYLIWRILKNISYRSKVTIAYLLHPLLLVEQVADAHVDVFLCTIIVIIVGFLYQRRYIAASFACWLGFLIKTIPIIWIPLLFIFCSKKCRSRSFVIIILLSITLLLSLSMTVFPNVKAWGSLFNPGLSGLVASSFHHLCSLLIRLIPTFTKSDRTAFISLLETITKLGFIIYYIGILLKLLLKENPTEQELISDIGWVTFVLIFFATPWVMPWYSSILLPIAALSLSDAPWFVFLRFAFSLSSRLILSEGAGLEIISIITTLSKLTPPIIVLILGPKFAKSFLSRLPWLSENFYQVRSQKLI